MGFLLEEAELAVGFLLAGCVACSWLLGLLLALRWNECGREGNGVAVRGMKVLCKGDGSAVGL